MNESRTCANAGANLTQPRSAPVRYRLTDKDGKLYAPFRVRPGVKLAQVMPDDCEIEVIR